MVPRTGFEPVISGLKGRRARPLHQRGGERNNTTSHNRLRITSGRITADTSLPILSPVLWIVADSLSGMFDVPEPPAVVRDAVEDVETQICDEATVD